jgi:hypothetical protein
VVGLAAGAVVGCAAGAVVGCAAGAVVGAGGAAAGPQATTPAVLKASTAVRKECGVIGPLSCRA